MKDFIEFIARSIVDEPDSVKIDERREDNRVFLRLNVDKSDLGKVIGKHGKTANAMRVLLNAYAAKHNMSGSLDIEDGRDN